MTDISALKMFKCIKNVQSKNAI